MEKNKVVCLCKHVTEETIRETIKNGADSVEEVGEITGAGTQCGACKKIIEKLIIPDNHC